MTTTSMVDAARRSRPVYRGSEQFRLLGLLFDTSQPHHLCVSTDAERIALSRLVKAGLVEAFGKEVDTCSSQAHTVYSITLAGRAHFAASEFGLSFVQLCYLAYARRAVRYSVMRGKSSFVAAMVDPIFSVVFAGISPTATRKELAKKGFLLNRTWHTYQVAGRFAELEARHAQVMDSICVWMRAEYNERLKQEMRDPVIAKMVGLVSRHSE